MMYSFIATVVRVLLVLLNGLTKISNKDRLPQGNYVLVSPHRTWLDSVYLALAVYPKKCCFMAKKELFRNPVMNWLIRKMNAFPVNRENPGPSALKTPVKYLKETELCFVIFPSGSRHETTSKAGAAVIARMAQVPVVPAVYQGPKSFKELLLRRKTKVNFGEPIIIDSKEAIEQFDSVLKNAFAQLDAELDPQYTLKEPNSQN